MRISGSEKTEREATGLSYRNSCYLYMGVSLHGAFTAMKDQNQSVASYKAKDVNTNVVVAGLANTSSGRHKLVLILSSMSGESD